MGGLLQIIMVGFSCGPGARYVGCRFVTAHPVNGSIAPSPVASAGLLQGAARKLNEASSSLNKAGVQERVAVRYPSTILSLIEGASRATERREVVGSNPTSTSTSTSTTTSICPSKPTLEAPSSASFHMSRAK